MVSITHYANKPSDNVNSAREENLSEPVLFERRGAVAYLTINRPERRNALNEAVAAGLMAGLDRAEGDRDVRAVVLTGAGEKAFCAGGDLNVDAEGGPFAIDVADPRHFIARLLRRLEACRLPIMARVNGHAIAGGFGLLAACDLVVARQDALLGVSEVKIGLFPMMILPVLLRAVPHRTLMEMCLSGEPITAAEASMQHIVNYSVPMADLDAKVDWLLDRITTKSPTGIRLGKQALGQIRHMSFDAALEYGQLMIANMARTQDAREGMAAFVEKRPARWTAQ